MKIKASQAFNSILILLVAAALLSAGFWVNQWIEETRVLRQVIDRLSADSRIAEALVTKSEWDETAKKIKTTIKFLEYDTKGNPVPAKYFTFSARHPADPRLPSGGQGNIIQFQALVVRFEDRLVRAGDKLRGKSAYLFMKAFVLDGEKTQEFDIAKAREVPAGYKIEGGPSEFETKLWEEFWKYALNPKARSRAGIKNAQIEAPGSLFVPGTIYTLRIEHDGGMRIDTQPIPEILKGENL